MVSWGVLLLVMPESGELRRDGVVFDSIGGHWVPPGRNRLEHHSVKGARVGAGGRLFRQVLGGQIPGVIS